MSNKHSDISHPLLDRVINDFKLKNDLGLARFLGIGISTVSKIRSSLISEHPYRLPGDMIITIHEKTGMLIAQIKALAGMKSGVE